jgi:uncharacterized protein
VSAPFVVNLGSLCRRAGTRRPVEVAGPLADLSVSGSSVPAGALVEAELILEALQGDAVLAEGTVRAPWEGPCRRCLGPASGTVSVPVRELFETTPDEEDIYLLKGDQIDLEPLVRDAVLLELPQAPLCTEGCRGLCPTCGTNLNEGTCPCETEVRDPRWAALDELRERS